MSVDQTGPSASASAESVEGKGLKGGTLGLSGATVMGLASVAPMYSLTATVGFVVAAVGVYAPAVMLFAFIPMLFVAYGYRELNNAVPDCGTSFTWGVKAFGPYVGWMAGWGLIIASVVSLSSYAQVIGSTFFEIFGSDLAQSTFWVSAVGIIFMVVMAYVSIRGMEGSEHLQMVLVILQYIAIALLGVSALWAVYHNNGQDGSIEPSLSWLNPFEIDSFTDFTKGILLCLFIYWGWDTILSLNEETKDPEKTPGRAAILATVILLGGYLFLTTATVSYAGVGNTGIGLNNPVTQDSVLPAIALPLLGQWGNIFIIIVIMLSTIATAQTTILPTARSTLAMAVYKALPDRFAKIHPKYMTPVFSTVMTCAVGIFIYVALALFSDSVLEDTVSSVSLGIAFYYGITAFSCVWFYRRQSLKSAHGFVFQFLLPLLGGLMLAGAFFISAYQMWSPDYGNTSLWDVGTVFIIGVGSLLFGVVLMLLWQWRQPAFFRGETLRADTPVLAPE